jgi:hypothetical protein
MVVRRARALVTVGLVLGVAGAAPLGRAIRGIVSDLPVSGPAALIAAAVVHVITAAAAACVPASRAAAVEPMPALRAD